MSYQRQEEYGAVPVDMSVYVMAVLGGAALGAGCAYMHWTNASLGMAGAAGFIAGFIGVCLKGNLFEGIAFSVALGGLYAAVDFLAPYVLDGELMRLALPAIVGFCVSQLVLGAASEMA